MRKPFLSSITTLALGLSSTLVSAQYLPGLVSSNYGGIQRMLQNPSSVAGTRYKYQVVLFNGASTVNSVYTKYLTQGFFQTLQLPYSQRLSLPLRTVGSFTGGPRTTSYSELVGPSFLVNIGGTQTLALHTRMRSFLYGSSLPEPLAAAYRDRLTYRQLATASGSFDFGLTHSSYSEIGLTYGLQVFDGKWHRLKLGATVRYLGGAQLTTLSAQGNYAVQPISGSDEKSLSLTNLQYNLAYTTARQGFGLGSLFSSGYGSGLGYDFGATYEIGRRTTGRGYNAETPMKDPRPAYLIRLSAALMNGGNIRYPSGPAYTGSQSLTFQQEELEKFGNAPTDYLTGKADGSQTTYAPGTVTLPRMLHLEADLRLARSFYVNGLMMKNLKQGPTVPMPDMFVITPRFEDEDAEFALPISVIGPDGQVAVGASVRLGPVTLGFSDMGRLFFNKNGDNRSSIAWLGLSLWKFRK